MLFILGILTLWIGAELLVRSAVQMALFWKVSRLVIGLTIVAFATSAPELFTSVLSQFKTDDGTIALGNVLGSNITNIGLVLGIYILLRPCHVSASIRTQKLPILLFVYLLVFFVMLGGKIILLEGIFLLLVLGLYIAYEYLFPPKRREIEKELKLFNGSQEKKGSIYLSCFGVIGGVGLLVFGTELFLDSSIGFATLLDISERTIAVSLVAFGTSVPELATALVAARRKEKQIIVGTLLGSNIFNSLLIIPCAVFIHPIVFAPKLLYIDFSVMTGFALLLLCLLFFGTKKLHRWKGFVLVFTYVLYLFFLFF